MIDDKIINETIQEKIRAKEPVFDILVYVKGECQGAKLTPQTLGMLFELYAEVNYDENDPLSGYSREISISELRNIHPCFESSNGC